MFLHGDGRSNLLFQGSLITSARTFTVKEQDQGLRDYIKAKKPTKCIKLGSIAG
ncbi:hypothetical protein ACTU3I_04380 [Microbacterium sp. RD1]|uniref:hypothetical protein n=1 Tax=Microbacterium sp. RD1 TaxID=3457313 RepID=UPI003FA593BB